jgi:hypothetical protein
MGDQGFGPCLLYGGCKASVLFPARTALMEF